MVIHDYASTKWINESVHIELSDFPNAAAAHISRTENSTNCLLASSLSVYENVFVHITDN